ncbi:MAG: hypothetical protein M1132_03425 [Chloroflexi bacterium]|nr:hypothetical protein [Chloroflexota bacterium]
MEQQFNTEGMLTRIEEVWKLARRSDIFPAVAGAVAGGIAGALMAVIISGHVSSRRSVQVVETAENETEKKGFSLNARDLVQLVTVVAGLVRQVQAWNRDRETK